MISELKVGNFKAFGPAQTIPLRPITLVFGPNSAGKSSIIQSLLLARHIQDTGKADAHHTILGGKAIDLGGFHRYVRNHDVKLQTSLEFTFQRSAIARKLHDLDAFKTVRIAYAIGNVVSAIGVAEIVITAATLFVDENLLLHLVRSGSGELRVDELVLRDHSRFAAYTSWTQIFAKNVEQMLSELPETERSQIEAARSVLLSLASEEKEHVVRELSGMSFGADSFALENLTPLTREYPDFEVFGADADFDRPDRDPYGFSRRDLQRENDVEPSEQEVSARAFRYYVEWLIEGVNAAVSDALKRVSYLGPLRWIPPRHLLEPDESDATWIAGGGDTWLRLRGEGNVLAQVNRFLREALHTRYQLRCYQLSPTLDAAAIELCIKQAREKIVGAPLERRPEEGSTARVAEEETAMSRKATTDAELAAAVHAELTSHTARETLIDLRIVDSDSGLAVSHRDVGTGISQLLPVIVNAAAAQGKLIAIEQPELHLHPALQAELGDVFIESALGSNKNTFLIETHSEHLILRLLRRVRDTTAGTLSDPKLALRPEDISVLYVRPGKDGSEVLQMPVTPDGDFACQWPGGFFAERAEELF